MSQIQSIAVDFDGVLHKYSKGWNDGAIYDEPIDGAKEAYLKLTKKGYRVIVFTTRKNIEDVKKWISKNFGIDAEVTDKKPLAVAYIDDRAIRFTNWKDILNYF